MSTSTSSGRRRPPKRPAKAAASHTRTSGGFSDRVKLAGVLALAVVALGVIFALNHQSSSPSASSAAGRFAFAVGAPGPGQLAPPVRLPSTAGRRFDLGAQHGRSVLLYFQEGLTCQPCWDQLKDIERNMNAVRALGVSEVVSVTTDPLGALAQKASDEGLHSPILSDQTLAVSRAYDANSYGMMGASRDGHSFVLVGPDGRIRWRADYGGAPDYTMYVPVPNLLADLRKGLGRAGA